MTRDWEPLKAGLMISGVCLAGGAWLLACSTGLVVRFREPAWASQALALVMGIVFVSLGIAAALDVWKTARSGASQ